MRALYLWLYYGHTKNDGYAWWLSDSLLGLELWMVAVLYLVSLRPAPIAAPSVKVRPAKKGSRPVMAATCHNPRIKEHQARSQDEMDKSTSESASPLGKTKLRFKAGHCFKPKRYFFQNENEQSQSQQLLEVAWGKNIMRGLLIEELAQVCP